MEASVRIEHDAFLLPFGTGRPVVFFVPWLTRGGGGERFVRDIAQGMVDDGRTVVVIVTHGCPPGMTDATEEMLAITPYVYDLTRFLKPETWLTFCRSMIWRLGTPILINTGSTWLYENIAALRRAGRGRISVFDQLFNDVGHVQSSVAAGHNIDVTLTTHQALERMMAEQYRVPSRVVTVPIGIDPPANGDRPQRPENSRPVIGWLGRLSGEKRPEWFVQLAKALGNLAHFRLAGEGPLSSDLERSARHVPSLELSGFVDDALEFIAACDLLVVTSEIEGIPLVAMEALACGTPVVATQVGGLADLIEPGVNGVLVAADDPGGLIAQVGSLLEKPDELRALQASTASTGLADRFTTAAMLERYRELLV
jgi:glycosyltransferase involved in cell wall biosynthesis